MWKVGQWYRFGSGIKPTRFCCEYVTSTGVALLRCEKGPEVPVTYSGAKQESLTYHHYYECEPPSWAELEYDPSQQKDEDDDV